MAIYRRGSQLLASVPPREAVAYINTLITKIIDLVNFNKGITLLNYVDEIKPVVCESSKYQVTVMTDLNSRHDRAQSLFFTGCG